MTDPSTGRAIVNAIRASLRLVSSSSELLTISQLLAVKSDLRETLAIVNGQIGAMQSGTFPRNVLECLATYRNFTDDHKLIINMSDWEDEEEESALVENQKGDGNTGGKYSILPGCVAALSRCHCRSR